MAGPPAGDSPEELADGDDPAADEELPLVWERQAEPEQPVDRLPEVRPAYRRRQRLMGAVALPLAVVLVPTMQIVFLIIVWVLTRSDETIRRVAPILGMLSSVAIVAGLANWLAMLGNRRLEHALRSALRERFKREGGELVGLSRPDGRSFIQQQLEGQSDIGVLYEDTDALVYEGMGERHVIKHADVVAVELAPNWQFIQFAARWCLVRYRVLEGGQTRERELRFVSRRERTVRRNVHATRALTARVTDAVAEARG